MLELRREELPIIDGAVALPVHRRALENMQQLTFEGKDRTIFKSSVEAAVQSWYAEMEPYVEYGHLLRNGLPFDWRVRARFDDGYAKQISLSPATRMTLNERSMDCRLYGQHLERVRFSPEKIAAYDWSATRKPILCIYQIENANGIPGLLLLRSIHIAYHNAALAEKP